MRGRWLVGAVALMLVTGLNRVRADDAEWEKRLERELVRLEAKVKGLDGVTAQAGSLRARVEALDTRIAKLEDSAGLVVGKVTIAAENFLHDVTSAIVQLEGRIRTIEKGPKEEEEQDPFRDESEARPNETTPTDPEWPATLRFVASGNITYTAVGDYYPEYTEFLQTGWDGSFHVTLRAAQLEREITEAYVVLVVRPQSIFKAFLQDVDWRARQSLWNGAKNTWMNLTSGSCRGPVRWISKASSQKRLTMNCRVEAVVVYVVTKEGNRINFQVPSYVAKVLGR